MPKFVPRERKHKRLAKQKQHSKSHVAENSASVEPVDSTLPLDPREARRATLTSDLRAQHAQPEKISAQKRKRMDKYIDTKLRKEENLELLKKLAKHKVDTSLLQSSRKLGRVNETKRERLGRALREQQAGLEGRGNEEVLLERRKEVLPGDAPADFDHDEDDSEDEEESKLATTLAQPINTTQTSIGLGSGLKRPLEVDEAGQPVIKKRKRRKQAKKRTPTPDIFSEDEETPEDMDTDDVDDEDGDEDEWNGFDSADGESESKDGAEDDEDSASDEEDDLEESDEESESEESDSDVRSDRPERVSAFKAWANAQRNVALDFTPSTAPTNDEAIKAAFKPRQQSPDPVLNLLKEISTENLSRPAAAITIPRVEAIQAARMELPVVQEEQRIMEAIHNNPVVVICGATGSGKTTQVPQMMFESGYGSEIGVKDVSESKGMQMRGLIGVTQPRRVAAVSVAERVATELGPDYRKKVAHQVRYDTNVSQDTAIKFMTDGILLREISNDFILSKYSAIVIDEAHERSVNTDILIGMLSRIVSLRSQLAKEEPEKHYALKLVIMSATLRVSDFAQNQRLFRSKAPPIVQAEGRQFPVTEHFSRKTHRDYVSEMVRKVARGHRKLPPGGMLVFLTAQNEIQTVAKQLKEKLGSNTAGITQIHTGRSGADQMPLELDDFEDEATLDKKEYLEGEDSDEDSELEITGLDDDEDDREFQVDDDHEQSGSSTAALKPHILPLYAALPSAQQLRVFQSPPDGSRLIVLATNVAETSLTIPGIRYVFDCGRSKEKRYDIDTGVQTYEIDWISKASASQRAGRAGRTGPGHCYRLFSSAVYEQFFAQHTVPEILRTPLESTVLQLKSMEIENVVNFPFPTAPDAAQLVQADRLLRNLGAIDERDGRITETGREIMKFPVNPRYGKMLLLAQRNNVLALTIALVAGLAIGDLLIPEVQFGQSAAKVDDSSSDDDESYAEKRAKALENTAAQTAAQKRHQEYNRAHAILARWDDQSDAIKLLTAVAAHAEASSQTNSLVGAAAKFCSDFFLREKGMLEVQQLRHQLHSIVVSRNQKSSNSRERFNPAIPLPTEKERKMLNQIVAAGFIDQIAIRADLLEDNTSAFGRKPRRAGEVAYRTLIPSSSDEPNATTLSAQDLALHRSVFIHPSSLLARLSVKEMPSYIIYTHLSRAPPATINSTKIPRTRMHPLTTVGPKQLAALAEGTPLLELGKPIGKIEEVDGGKKRMCWISVALRAPGTGMASWPLGAWKVVQKKKGASHWEVERIISR
ncbi:Hypothetical protein R9X50_00377500 [Acrodontium crateriforme]|uniref:RNA helicase n=1 Tax=Acrodontium crateriforme TaxID=150365 RepID=A0AAQ3M6T3_9PEZI|nr:Hypothetical protein R9X50_00377500 [Acrodontium crateriforme]